MSEGRHEIVVVRRRASPEEEHHGGAWKIAFADFMTAMMAFFLVLWIISATDKNTKTLIARYFNPVRLEEPARAQRGIHGGPEQNTNAPGQNSKSPKVERPENESEGLAEPAPASGSAEAKARRWKPDSPIPPDPSKPYPTLSEEELFRDPRASLDKIAGAPPPGPRMDATAALKGYGEVGPSADEALRDPFRPLGSDKAVNAASDPGAPAAKALEGASTPPSQSEAQQAPASPPDTQSAPAAEARTEAVPVEAKEPAPQAPPSPTPQKPEEPALPAPTSKPTGADEAARLLAEVKKRLGPEAPIAGPQLDIRATDEGVLISLTDRQNFAMFALGSAEPQPRVIKMMDAIAMSLEATPGQLVVRGHTDAHPYRSGTYDNWRLSSARAQMAYYMLMRGGVPEKRFDRIEGFANHRLKDPAHPFAPENRRIEILLSETKP